MVSVLDPRDIRRAAASAGLLASDKEGERAAAAFALCRILLHVGLDPASVVRAGLQKAAPHPQRVAGRPASSSGLSATVKERVRVARHSPHINGCERDFLTGMMDRSRLSQSEAAKLQAILHKAEGGKP